MAGLQAERMRYVPSDDGVRADVLFLEPTGEEHQIRCLCLKNGGTELGERFERGHIDHLVERYGSQVVVALARLVTLA